MSEHETELDLPEEDDIHEENREEDENQERSRKNKCALWKFFKKLPPIAAKRARCQFCREVRSYKSSTSNLKLHLKRRHKKAFDHYMEIVHMVRAKNAATRNDPDYEESAVRQVVPRISGGVRDPAIWQYFDNISPAQKKAKCKFCDKSLSYQTTVTNLKRHLAIIHRDLIDLDNDETMSNIFSKDSNDLESHEQKYFKEETNDIVKNRKNKSDIWRYFQRVDKINKLARCNTCQQLFNCTSITNLRMHLERMHPNCAVAIPRDPADDNQTETGTRKRKKTSAVWTKFTVFSEDDKIATCDICEQKCSYKSSVSNLSKHLKTMHGLTADSSFDSLNTQKSQIYPPRENNRKKLRSGVWKYYDIVDSEKKLAKCKQCDRILSYLSFSNMRAHLRRHVGYEHGEEEIIEEHTSPVWAYFKCLSRNQKLASCLICKKRVDYGDEGDLRKHLSRKHPQAFKELETNTDKPRKLMITGNGDIYEIDENITKSEPPAIADENDDDTNQWPDNDDEVDVLETEFLDEKTFSDPKIEPKKTHFHQNTPKRTRNEWRQTNHQRIQESEDSLDIFGKYIISLLKKLPKHKSDRLQADFVRQIMDAQNGEETNERIRTQNINNESIRLNNICTTSNIQNTPNTCFSASIKNVTKDSSYSATNIRDTNIDDVVTSNSEVIGHLVVGNDGVIVTSVGDKITIRSSESLNK